MPQCLHGWGSDGINPSGCPQCDVMGRERDKAELSRLRPLLAAAESVAKVVRASASPAYRFPEMKTLVALLDTMKASA